MAERRNKKGPASSGATIFMVAAVVLSGLAGLMISRLLAAEYPDEPLRPVVVATRDLDSGRTLQAADLRLTKWPVSSIPRGAFASKRQLLALKPVALLPLPEGAAILGSHLSRPRSGIGVAAKLDAGKRAVAVQTDAALAVAELLYPGARVDVLSTVKRLGGKKGSRVRTKTILQNVTVLAVGPDIDAASVARRGQTGKGGGGISGVSNDGGDQRAARRVVTLSVTPEEAERLVLANRGGGIDLVLRSQKDVTPVPTSGATFEMLHSTNRSADALFETAP
jgi:pilus assembly protein CpaB